MRVYLTPHSLVRRFFEDKTNGLNERSAIFLMLTLVRPSVDLVRNGFELLHRELAEQRTNLTVIDFRCILLDCRASTFGAACNPAVRRYLEWSNKSKLAALSCAVVYIRFESFRSSPRLLRVYLLPIGPEPMPPGPPWLDE